MKFAWVIILMVFFYHNNLKPKYDGSHGDKMSLSSIRYVSPCSAASLPFFQDFETVTPPALPNCASQINLSNGNNWKTYQDTQTLHSRVLRYKHDLYESANTWYFTQGVQLVANTNYQISFTIANSTTNTNFFEKLKVGFGASDQPSAMQLLANYPHISGGLAHTKTLVFEVPADGVYYFGFDAYSNFNASDLYLDNIAVQLGPDCAAPTALYYTNLTHNSVDFTWNQVGTPVAWKVFYGQEGFIPGSEGFVVSVQNTATIHLQNLTPDTAYQVYIKAICGNNQSSSLSSPKWFHTRLTPPANNDLCHAISLQLNADCQNISYSTSGAYPEPDEHYGSCLKEYAGKNSVWFKFTAPNSGEIILTTAFSQTNFLTELTIYEAPSDCANLSTLGIEIGCAGYGATIDLPNLTPGHVYVVKVTGYKNKNGSFCISAETT